MYLLQRHAQMFFPQLRNRLLNYKPTCSKSKSNPFLHHQRFLLTSPSNSGGRRGREGQEVVSSSIPGEHNLCSCSFYTASLWKLFFLSIFILTGLPVHILLRDWSHPLLPLVVVIFISIQPPNSSWKVYGAKGRSRVPVEIPFLWFTKSHSVNTIGRT